MIPSRYPQNLGTSWDNFITTYGQDYRPYEERHLQVGPGTSWPGAEAVHTRVRAPQAHFQLGTNNWPLSVRKCFYQTTNSTYGSSVCWTPAQTSPYPVFPFVPEASAVRTQEVSEEEKRRLQFTYGGEANETKDKPRPEVEVYEDGVMVLLCPGRGACSCLGCACCLEAVLQYLQRSGGTSAPVYSVNGRITPHRAGLNHSAALQAGVGHYAWCQPCGCSRAQSAPCGQVRPLQPVVEYREPVVDEWLTEYRASYVPPWTKPRV